MPSYSATERAYELRQLYARMVRYALFFLAVGLGYLSASIWASALGSGLDSWALRRAFELRGPIEPPAEVLVVGVDEEIQNRYGRPLPRRFIAEGLERIVTAKPRLMILDASLPKDDLDNSSDRRIAQALAAVPSVIDAGKFNTRRGDSRLVALSRSDEVFRNAAAMEIPMLFTATEETIATISRDFERGASLYQRAPLARALVELGGLEVGKPGPYDLINYYGPPGTITHLTLQQLLERSPAEIEHLIAGKVVFFGFQTVGEESAAEMNNEEFKISASRRFMYGVEIHATIAANLLERSWIRRLDFGAESALVYLSSFLISVLLFFLPPFRAYVSIAAVLGVESLLCYLAFVEGRTWVPGLMNIWLFAVASIVLTTLYRELYLAKLMRYLSARLEMKLEEERYGI